MRPKERRDSGQTDLLRARIDQIVDMGHPLAKLARAVDWRFLEERFGAAYSDKPGHPPLPSRLMAGLSILKSMHDLSDEALWERWGTYHMDVAGILVVEGQHGGNSRYPLEGGRNRKDRVWQDVASFPNLTLP